MVFTPVNTCYMPITGTGSYFYWRKYFSVAISGTLVLTDAGGGTTFLYSNGEIGRHLGFKHRCFRACEFESRFEYNQINGQLTATGRPFSLRTKSLRIRIPCCPPYKPYLLLDNYINLNSRLTRYKRYT